MAFVGDGARVLVGGESPRVFSLPSGVPEDGETVLGEAWAELDVTADASRRLARASSPPLGLRISGIDRDPAPFLLPRIPEFPALQNHFVPILLSQDGRWAALHPTRGARMVPLVEGMGSVRRLPAPPRGEGEEEDREGMAGATLSPKGDVLVTFDRRGLLAWDTASGAGLARLPLTRSSSGMPAFSPAGDRVLFGLCFEGGETPRRSVVLSWDPRQGGRPSEVVSWADPTSCLHAVSVSRDGKILAATDGMAIQTWTLADGKRHRTLESGPSGIWAIRVSPDNRFLVAWGDAGNHVWSLETGRILSPPLVHSGRITSLAFDSTGARLVAVGGGRMVQWDVARATPSVAHDGPLNGGPLGGGYVDGDAGLWMVESVFEGPGSPDSSSIRRRRYSATSSSGIGTSYRGGVSDFGGRLRQAFSRDGSMVVEVVKTPQGEMAYISRVGAASVEDAKDEPVEPGSPFALAPRGKWLAAVQPGKDQLLVTDVVSGNDWYELPVRGGRLQALAITDTWTVAAAVPGAIEFFHQEKVADPAAIPVDPTPAVLAFSDDERWLAAASGSLVSVARLGKAPEWLRAETRQGGWASRVEILAFDRTGSRLAAGHRDGSITVFSLPTGPAAR